MNFGQALNELIANGVNAIRRTSWKPEVALTVDLTGKLAWVEAVGDEWKAELVSCLPATEIMAADWEVVSD